MVRHLAEPAVWVRTVTQATNERGVALGARIGLHSGHLLSQLLIRRGGRLAGRLQRGVFRLQCLELSFQFSKLLCVHGVSLYAVVYPQAALTRKQRAQRRGFEKRAGRERAANRDVAMLDARGRVFPHVVPLGRKIAEAICLKKRPATVSPLCFGVR